MLAPRRHPLPASRPPGEQHQHLLLHYHRHYVGCQIACICNTCYIAALAVSCGCADVAAVGHHCLHIVMPCFAHIGYPFPSNPPRATGPIAVASLVTSSSESNCNRCSCRCGRVCNCGCRCGCVEWSSNVFLLLHGGNCGCCRVVWSLSLCIAFCVYISVITCCCLRRCLCRVLGLCPRAYVSTLLVSPRASIITVPSSVSLSSALASSNDFSYLLWNVMGFARSAFLNGSNSPVAFRPHVFVSLLFVADFLLLPFLQHHRHVHSAAL